MSDPVLLAFAVVGVLVGSGVALRPYEVAKLSEMLDAIGRKPAGPVEPADWYVLLHRAMGVLIAILGLFAAVSYFTAL